MTALETIEVLINLINTTDNLPAEAFNKHPDVLRAYAIVYGQDELNATLASKNDLHLNRFYSPDWALRAVVGQNAVATADIRVFFDKIENKYTRNWLILFLIERAVAEKEFELCEVMIAGLPDEDKGPVRYAGHRVLLKHYAATGNVVEFKKRLKLSKPAKFPKNEIGGFKALLIESFARENGYEKALELCGETIFGQQFAPAALRWTAHLMDLDKIEHILAEHASIVEHTPNAKADLYVRHFANQKPTTISDLDFNRVLEEVLRVDKDIKMGDGRLRDFLLMDLGSATSNQTQTTTCKKIYHLTVDKTGTILSFKK
ncbi:hypothetical protein SAMN04488109_4762 [Chryseolinea serpens]|uniref:Uncharacterized protein n=1 Tax=Chryseolinea serpens TaxID=947013 RepID=A0A1M5ULF6_9BACT|nr:hypothetical protein [Chryseolinea serpens]SHH63819.1 hypothetical protein SAMN04488109_4762 [Chryseolinea serpens]